MSLSLAHGRPLDVGHYGLTANQLPPAGFGATGFADWFAGSGDCSPLELEVGSGKGTFLVQQAMATPQVCYIGVERALSFWRYAADRCRRHGLENVRIIHCEAGAFMREHIDDSRLDQVHIYFSDPWPKKRHHKRRVVQEPFLRLAHRKLKPGGRVRIVTDHTEYFQSMDQHAQRVGDLFDRLPFEGSGSAGDQEWVGSNFERKYRRLGRSFHGMILCKRG